jgi:hypothetical protein
MHVDTLHTSLLLLPVVKAIRVLDAASQQCHFSQVAGLPSWPSAMAVVSLNE